MQTRKLYLTSDDFTITTDGYIYVPSSKVVDSFEKLKAIVVNKVVLTMSTEPESGVILVESDSIGRKLQTNTAVASQNHKNVICSVSPMSRHAVTITSSSNSTALWGTDSDIEGISDLLVWTDLDSSRMLNSSFVPVSGTAGDEFSYIYNRSPGPSTLIFVSNSTHPFELKTLGSNLGYGMTSAVLGMYLQDSTQPTGNFAQEFTINHIFKAPASYNDTTTLFNFYYARVQFSPNGVISYRDDSGGSGSNTVVSSLLWIPLRDYLFTLQRKYNTTSSSYQFIWTIEDLSAVQGLQTATTGPGPVVTSTQPNMILGTSGQYHRHTGGPMILFNGISATEDANAKLWLRNWFNGTTTSSSSSTTTTTNGFQWISQPDVRLPVNQRVLDAIDLKFSSTISKFAIDLLLEY